MINPDMPNKKELVQIKMLLKTYPRGLTITDISKEIKINRNSVARYMDVLTILGQVEMRALGPAKVFYSAQRVPMSAMLNFSSDGILVVNNDLKIIQMNDNLLKILNIEREAILGLGIADFLNPIFTSQESHSKVKEVLDGKEVAFEKKIQVDEREIYFYIKMLPTTFDDGTIGLTWILQDITDRKKAETALHTSEEQYRNLFESSREGIIFSGPDGRISRMNNAGAAMMGYDSPEEPMGIPAIELYLDSKAREAMFKEITERGYVENYELTLKKRDGSPIHVLCSALTRCNEDGNIMQTEAFITDITERKKAEESLRQSEEKYRSLFVNMLNGYAYCKIILDEKNKPIDFVYLEVNDAFERLTGLKKEEVLGKRVTEAISGMEEAHPELFEVYGRVALTNKEEVFDIKFKPLNIWLHISVYSPRKGYFVAIFENITERKEVEEEIKIKDNAMKSSINAIALADIECNLTYVNSSFLEMWGFGDDKEVLGSSVDSFWMRSEDALKVVKALELEGSWLGELTARKRDGSPFEVQLSANVVTDETGKPTCMMASFIDITERKSMEKEFREARLALREEIKEVTFFYTAFREMQTAKSAEDLIPKLIDLLVQAMQFPEITTPVVKIEGKRFAHKRYRENLTHGIHSEICIDNQSIGRVSIYYSENRPFIIPHEQNMINALADNLGGWVTRTRLVCRLT